MLKIKYKIGPNTYNVNRFKNIPNKSFLTWPLLSELQTMSGLLHLCYLTIAELYQWLGEGDDCVISSARNGRHGRRKILLRQSSRADKLFVWSSDYVVGRYAWRAVHDRRSISCGNNTLLLSDKRTNCNYTGLTVNGITNAKPDREMT